MHVRCFLEGVYSHLHRLALTKPKKDGHLEQTSVATLKKNMYLSICRKHGALVSVGNECELKV